MVKFHMDDRAERVLDLFELKDSQINISIVNSTTHEVAWHCHKVQIDMFYCIKGSFKVGLAEEHKHENRLTFEYLSDRDPTKFIIIKPGIYHGYRALEPGSIMLYYLSEKYNPNDEFRKPVGFFGEKWEVENK